VEPVCHSELGTGRWTRHPRTLPQAETKANGLMPTLAENGSGAISVMCWRYFPRRTRFRRRSNFARPYICRLIVLMRLTFPSTPPELRVMVSPLTTAAWSFLRPVVKERRAGRLSALTLSIQSSRRSPCRPVRVLANSVPWPARASRWGPASAGVVGLCLVVRIEMVGVGHDPAGQAADLGAVSAAASVVPSAKDVTKAFGFVASTFSDLRSFDWETLELRATHAYGPGERALTCGAPPGRPGARSRPRK
jgi:hypothetical protein